MNSERTRVSIVIPVYNAETTIELLTSTLIQTYGSCYALEVVLVNDGSTDGTDSLCKRLHQRNPDIVSYLRLSRNFGEHCAVMAGLNHASGDLCVLMDDDYQNPPDQVGELVCEIQKGYDVVYSFYDDKRDSWWRNLGSRFNDKVANWVLRKPADLYLSSFKVMNRFVVDQVTAYTGATPYLDAIILRTTNRVGKVKTRHNPRLGGKSGYSFRKLLSLWGNMVVSWSLVPVRLLALVGLAMTAFGAAAMLATVAGAALPGGASPGDYDKLQSGMLFFRGVQLLATSLVGEYAGRLCLAVGRAPQFIVREALPSGVRRGEKALWAAGTVPHVSRRESLPASSC